MNLKGIVLPLLYWGTLWASAFLRGLVNYAASSRSPVNPGALWSRRPFRWVGSGPGESSYASWHSNMLSKCQPDLLNRQTMRAGIMWGVHGRGEGRRGGGCIVVIVLYKAKEGHRATHAICSFMDLAGTDIWSPIMSLMDTDPAEQLPLWAFNGTSHQVKSFRR